MTVPVLPPPLLALVAGVGQRVLSGPTATPGPGRATVAVVVAAGSVTLAGAASRRFQQSGTTVQPFHPERSTTLVTTGANAISRNPMYVGMAGVLVAHAAWRGSLAALLPVAGFVAYIDRVQVRAEEEALLATFGSAYDDYRARVPRWLGLR